MKTTVTCIGTYAAPRKLICMLAVCWASLGASAVDPVLPFSAKLADKQGVPLDGLYSITSRIYAEPSGGTPLWTEVHNAAMVAKGILSLNLGSVSGFGALELTEGYWLGIAVGTDTEMSPRIQVPVQVITPAGTVAAFGGEAADVPRGWLLCDGRELPTASYPRLYKAIGKAWGTTTPTTFKLPDLRGLFLRGVDGNAGRDPDKAARSAAPGGNSGNGVGSYQDDEFRTHEHVFGGTAVLPALGYEDVPGTPWTQNASHSGSGSRNYFTKTSTRTPGANETRPKNAYVNYIIKY